jgi:predicted MarR family transcription regulator
MAMAQDDVPARMSDIQRRLDVDDNYASQYRLRLIAAELIYSTRRGYVDFALPYLREYLREHPVPDT